MPPTNGGNRQQLARVSSAPPSTALRVQQDTLIQRNAANVVGKQGNMLRKEVRARLDPVTESRPRLIATAARRERCRS